MAKQSRINDDVIDFVMRKVMPPNDGESHSEWIARCRRDPALLMRSLEGLSQADQIKLSVMRRSMRLAGGDRLGGNKSETAAVEYDAHGYPKPNLNQSQVAKRYQEMISDMNVRGLNHDETGDKSRSAAAEEHLKFVVEAFDYTTPAGGGIFWSGIDPNKLVGKVREWNANCAGMFGSLEATTDAKFLDGAFAFRGAGAKYWTNASAAYGHGASGHVTSVQMWGVQPGNIFGKTELPKILNQMQEDISHKRTPSVTDVSIVLLDPAADPHKECTIFTNSEICRIPLVGKKSSPTDTCWWINGRDDAKIVGYVSTMVPVKVKTYWLNRRQQQPSAAARKIEADQAMIRR